MARHQQHRAGGMAAQCRPHSYGRTCCCTRGHTSPDNGKRHTFHRCHPRQHITTTRTTPHGRQNGIHGTRSNFHGHHHRTRPGRFRTSRRPTFQLPPGKRSTVTATATALILPRFTANTAQEKAPHGLFSGGGYFLVGYKCHDFVSGFPVRGFYKLRF